MRDTDRDPLRELARWLSEQRGNIAGQVTVRETQTAHGARTRVQIDHRLSCPLPSFGGWRITTRRSFLPRAHFHSEPVHYLKTADHQRGRTIYCQDHLLDDEVVAAIRYHLDERASWPVFVTRIGFRTDLQDDAELRRRTVAGALVIKQYLHAISDALGRGGDVHIDLPPHETEVYARELGFRKAQKLKDLRVAGTHLCQPPVS